MSCFQVTGNIKSAEEKSFLLTTCLRRAISCFDISSRMCGDLERCLSTPNAQADSCSGADPLQATGGACPGVESVSSASQALPSQACLCLRPFKLDRPLLRQTDITCPQRPHPWHCSFFVLRLICSQRPHSEYQKEDWKETNAVLRHRDFWERSVTLLGLGSELLGALCFRTCHLWSRNNCECAGCVWMGCGGRKSGKHPFITVSEADCPVHFLCLTDTPSSKS